MARKRPLRNERVVFRATVQEKEMLEKAGDMSLSSASADMSEIAREASLLTAKHILRFREYGGDLTEEFLLASLEEYQEMLKSLIGEAGK